MSEVLHSNSAESAGSSVGKEVQKCIKDIENLDSEKDSLVHALTDAESHMMVDLQNTQYSIKGKELICPNF